MEYVQVCRVRKTFRDLYHDRRPRESNSKFTSLYRVAEVEGVEFWCEIVWKGEIEINVETRRVSVRFCICQLTSVRFDSSIVCRLLQNFNYSFLVCLRFSSTKTSARQRRRRIRVFVFFAPFLGGCVFPRCLLLSAKKKCFFVVSSCSAFFSSRIVVR